MTISVLIPQYGRSELTLRAVDSLRQHHAGHSLEILVVDDGSTASARRPLFALDQSGRSRGREARLSLNETWDFHEPVRHRNDETALKSTAVRVLVSPRRRGVTAAWNLAARQAQGDVLIFLNNDTVTTGNWCERMAMVLENSSHRVVGPEWRRTSELERQIGNCSRILAGWCLGMTRSTFQTLQGFDERFFLYFSDTDLQFRACSLWPDGLDQSGRSRGREAGLSLNETLNETSGFHEPVRHRNDETALMTVPTNSLRHLGHQTTRHWEGRHREWHLDQQRFFKKWGPQASSPAGEPIDGSDLFSADGM